MIKRENVNIIYLLIAMFLNDRNDRGNLLFDSKNADLEYQTQKTTEPEQ